MQAKQFYILLILTALSAVLFTSSINAQQEKAKGGYGDMLYPYALEYDQILSYKVSVDYGKTSEVKKLNAKEVLQIIERVDNLTRGIPKIVYIVGWQYTGHDTGYPSFSKVNEVLKFQDKTPLESLRWLMREGTKYSTRVSLHVNFSDCYLDDNMLGPKYQEHDILVRETDGRHRQGHVWNGHMAHRASNYRNWYQGTFKNNQIDPLFEMIPELKMSGSLHPDAWYTTENPYYQIDKHQDCHGMREMTTYVREKYNVDLTTEFDWGRPAGEDFVLYHPMIWHCGWNNSTPPDPMKIPSYIMTGGDAFHYGSEEVAEFGKFFGHSSTLESEINEDISSIPNGLKSFATRTLPWYFLNRHLRNKFNGDTALFSNNIEVTFSNKTIIKQNGYILADGNDVFIPALWKSGLEIIAYSENGYKNRLWKLPEPWNQVGKVDIYTITTSGLKLKSKETSITANGNLKISLNPDEGISILPSGTNLSENEKESIPSGKVAFIGTDAETKGSWKNIYGSNGFVIPGAENKAPEQVKINFINSEEQIWKEETQDIQAVEVPGESKRIASSRSHPLHQIIDFNFEDGNEHQVSIYFLDLDRRGRWSIVDIIDADSRKILHSFNLTDFTQGIYLKYKIQGHVQCRITNVWTQRYQNSPDTRFSAIFFD